MRSLDTGESPIVHVRMSKSRKAQLQALADSRKMPVSEVIREALTQLIIGLEGKEKTAVMKAALAVSHED